MIDLPRLRPEPIPAIHPLPEYLTEGPRKIWYADMKQAFQVPWMGVVTMAYAHYPSFYEILWQGVRDLCMSRPFVEAFLGNRAFAEAQVAKLDPPPIRERLREVGYAPREIDEIRQVVEVFSHGNQPYVCWQPSPDICWKSVTWPARRTAKRPRLSLTVTPLHSMCPSS